MKTLIQGGTLVNEGHSFEGSIIVEDGRISQILQGHISPEASFDEVIDASGCFVSVSLV